MHMARTKRVFPAAECSLILLRVSAQRQDRAAAGNV